MELLNKSPDPLGLLSDREWAEEGNLANLIWPKLCTSDVAAAHSAGSVPADCSSGACYERLNKPELACMVSSAS